MKINFNPAINFGKILSGKGYVLKDNEPLMCRIYTLDNIDDHDYFERVRNSHEWNAGENIGYIKYDLPGEIDDKDTEVLVMEEPTVGCLGVAEISQDCTGNYVNHLITNPSYENSSGKSKIRYIGETFLAFIAQYSKMYRRDSVSLLASDEVKDFYTKCQFRSKNPNNPHNHMLILDDNKFDSLIDQNTEHTGHEVEII